MRILLKIFYNQIGQLPGIPPTSVSNYNSLQNGLESTTTTTTTSAQHITLIPTYPANKIPPSSVPIDSLVVSSIAQPTEIEAATSNTNPLRAEAISEGDEIIFLEAANMPSPPPKTTITSNNTHSPHLGGALLKFSPNADRSAPCNISRQIDSIVSAVLEADECGWLQVSDYILPYVTIPSAGYTYKPNEKYTKCKTFVTLEHLTQFGFLGGDSPLLHSILASSDQLALLTQLVAEFNDKRSANRELLRASNLERLANIQRFQFEFLKGKVNRDIDVLI